MSKLIDISGNQNHGTISGAISTKDGLKFDGVDDYVELPLLDISTGTITIRFNQFNYIDNGMMLGSNIYNFILVMSNKVMRIRIDGLFKDFLINYVLNSDATLIITFYKDGSNIKAKVYFNGILSSSGEQIYEGVSKVKVSYLGWVGLNYYSGNIAEVRLFDRVLTEQEIKDYHNSFIKPVLLEDFSRNPVGNTTLRDWLIPKGGFVVEEEDFKTKYIKATSGSAINCAYTQSNLIEGEWQFDLKYTALTGYIAIASERPETSLTNFTGYVVPYNASGNSGNILIRRYVNGTATNLFLGSAGDISANKWWRLRFTKKSCGTINLYAKNLTDNEPWKEITTGTITDTTITKSGYFGLTLVPSGTQIKNIKIYNGVMQ